MLIKEDEEEEAVVAAEQTWGSAGTTPCCPRQIKSLAASLPSTVGGSDTAEQWEAGADSKAASVNFLGNQGSGNVLRECAHSGSHSPPHAREVCVLVTYPGVLSHCSRVSLHRQNHKTQWFNLKAHPKALEAKRAVI